MVLVAILALSAYLLYKKAVSVPGKKPPTLAQLLNKPKPSKAAQKITAKVTSKPIRNENGDLYLLENADFTIHYAPSPDAFFIRILEQDITKYDEINKKTESWFLSKGYSNDDMCKLTVIYQTDPNLRLINFKEELPSC